MERPSRSRRTTTPKAARKTAASSSRARSSHVAGSSPARLPKKVGSYEVKQALGKGAMGEVLLAVHEHLERPVALKRKHAVVAKGQISGEEADERFLREAKVLARLKH